MHSLCMDWSGWRSSISTSTTAMAPRPSSNTTDACCSPARTSLPLYPGTGTQDETGDGNIVNAPLPPDAGSALFRAAWTQRLLPAVDAFKPQLLMISAGFDAHRLDPLAQMNLEAADFAWLTA